MSAWVWVGDCVGLCARERSVCGRKRESVCVGGGGVHVCVGVCGLYGAYVCVGVCVVWTKLVVYYNFSCV